MTSLSFFQFRLAAAFFLLVTGTSVFCAAQAPTKSADAATSALLERAGVALRENQTEDARGLYQKVLERDPENAEAKRRLAGLERRGGRSAGAPDPDIARPTADGKGGATPQTASMPMDVAGLTKIRAGQLGRPEYRVGWITRMEWATPNPDQSRARITDVLDKAKSIGLNAVFFQVRGECATLYPSQLEPVSRLLGGTLNYDPLRFAIDEAHKRGLEFHAYFNVCTASDERNGPTDPRHIWFSHCQPGANPNWLVHEEGKPAKFNEYWWLNVNLPEVQVHVRRAAVDLVTRYEVDGLHYDRVRFPSSKVSDDPWSKARFAGTGNPNRLAWQEWQRENLNRLVADIYGSVTAIRPKLKVSASVWGIYDKTRLPAGTDRATGYSWVSSGLQDYNQDSLAWARAGSVDMLVPMIYWNMGGDKPDFDEVLAEFVRGSAGRFVVGGQRVFGPTEMLREAAASVLVGAQGQCPFTAKRVHDRDCVAMYQQSIYPDKVPVPEMPWKSHPKNGTLLVSVKDGKGMPVMDAQVRMAGRKDVWLSSADGFCAVLGADAGRTLTLTAEKPGVGNASGVATAKVDAGSTTAVVLSLN